VNLLGRKALVTGAGARLGRAIALALGDAGCDVALQYRDSRRGAEEVAHTLTSAGRRAVPLQADLADPVSCPRIVAEASSALGGLDVLVNNAGIFLAGDLATTTLEDWESQFALNLRAPFLLCQAFARQLRDGADGKIVNVTDARVGRPGVGHLAYRLTKAALTELTRLLALELAPRVTVNAVAPGAMLPPPGAGDEQLAARVASSVPLRRAGGTSPVVAAVLYLLREDFVTGVVLPVDGGEYL
jgi:NAD(P)-dependent dehydrogenase (short-subunit alcohol dehydrogenase family)